MKLKITKSLFLQKILNFMKIIINWRIQIIIVFLLFPNISFSQFARKTKVTFPSEDGLIITADNYFSKKSNPYILFFHQEGASRGEFSTIAERFIKMNYNCLAVDLRSGERYGFILNETASKAKEIGLSNVLYESLKDIRASIAYVKKINTHPVILFGSSFSASLALIAAMNDEDVKAVIAFSPGEFFLPDIEMKTVIQDINKPVFIGMSQQEAEYVNKMLVSKNNNNIVVFQPSDEPGKRTAEALLDTNQSNNEYWLALLIFMRSLQ